MTKTQSIEKGKLGIYAKLLEVKKAVPYIKKDDKTYQYTYASPEVVLGTINPLLNERDIFLKTEVIDSQSERVEIKDKNGLHMETLYHLKLRYTFIDTESGEYVEHLFESSGCNGEEKGLGSALTYAERYFLLKTFNIPTGDDDPDKNVRTYVGTKTAPAAKPIKSTTAPAKPAEEAKRKITDLAKHAGIDISTKESITAGILRVTGLDLIPANYGEIITRLTAILEENGSTRD